jgi:hypothetical protein
MVSTDLGAGFEVVRYALTYTLVCTLPLAQIKLGDSTSEPRLEFESVKYDDRD